jgi:nucleotide-binding universal stress UspA family protein
MRLSRSLPRLPGPLRRIGSFRRGRGLPDPRDRRWRAPAAQAGRQGWRRDDEAMFELGTDGPMVIVAGIDGSDSSMRAAAYAAGLARRQGAKLVLAYIRPMGTGNPQAGAAIMQIGEEVAEDLRRQIREGVDRLPPEQRVRWEFHTGEGDPYHGLVALADRLRADAVVIGASERAGHRLLGSVAVRMVKAGRWPVTVVP